MLEVWLICQISLRTGLALPQGAALACRHVISLPDWMPSLLPKHANACCCCAAVRERESTQQGQGLPLRCLQAQCRHLLPWTCCLLDLPGEAVVEAFNAIFMRQVQAANKCKAADGGQGRMHTSRTTQPCRQAGDSSLAA